MNKLLMEENDRLQKQVSRLVYENGHMKQQLHNVRLVSCADSITFYSKILDNQLNAPSILLILFLMLFIYLFCVGSLLLQPQTQAVSLW
jgi:hypothetical protein